MRWMAIEAWHSFVRTRDCDALRAALHPDVVFESPVVHAPQHGRELVLKYLLGAATTLGGPNSRFVNEWFNDDSAVLELKTQIDGIDINAVDIITVSADRALITHFKVMMRPLKAINLVNQLMSSQLAKGAT